MCYVLQVIKEIAMGWRCLVGADNMDKMYYNTNEIMIFGQLYILI
jgi:hypothetical protein